MFCFVLFMDRRRAFVFAAVAAAAAAGVVVVFEWTRPMPASNCAPAVVRLSRPSLHFTSFHSTQLTGLKRRSHLRTHLWLSNELSLIRHLGRSLSRSLDAWLFSLCFCLLCKFWTDLARVNTTSAHAHNHVKLTQETPVRSGRSVPPSRTG